jgi:hypothetical protein
MSDSIPLQLLVGYSTSVDISASGVQKYGKRAKEFGEVTVLILFGSVAESKDKLTAELATLKEVFLPRQASWVLLYPDSEHDAVMDLVEDGLRISEWQTVKNLESESLAFWERALAIGLSSLLEGQLDADHVRFSSWLTASSEAEKETVPIVSEVEEETMTIEPLVTQFWNRDPTLKSILLHTYLLQQQPESTQTAMFSQLKRRVSGKPAEIGAHISILESTEIMELGGSCFLRRDNGAYQAVEHLVVQEYEIDQDLDGMTGAEFLSISYDGRQAQAKRFTGAVKGTLVKNLPYLRCMDLSSTPYTFEIFLPGKWFAVFLCKTSSSLLKEQFVALAQAHKESLNRWLVMKSAFAVSCGPAFTTGATSLAQMINVNLIEAADFLKLAKYLSSLGEESHAAVHDYFPLVLSLSSGLVQMEKAIATVREAMEEKS